MFSLGLGPVITRVVTDRVFLLSLDRLYRTAMKRHERGELLECAEEVARRLGTAPSSAPVEGYYHEDPALTRYFRLVRGFQDEPAHRRHELADCAPFRRLERVTSSPLFGTPPAESSLLFPRSIDVLGIALSDMWPQWHVKDLAKRATDLARERGDYSLVALAALTGDPVMLAALRETVVLYEGVVLMAALRPPRYRYVWDVDSLLTQRAVRFVNEFNAMMGETLPQPGPDSAEVYWADSSDLLALTGRCVAIGSDPQQRRYYHWGLKRDAMGELVVHDFWSDELWTTQRYRASL